LPQSDAPSGVRGHASLGLGLLTLGPDPFGSRSASQVRFVAKKTTTGATQTAIR